jgi:hypothetical protein
MALMLAGYIYVWRKGALDWGSSAKNQGRIAGRQNG